MHASKAVLNATQLKAFEKYLEKKDLAPATVRVYLHDLKLLGQWLAQLRPPSSASLKRIGTPELAAYRKALIHGQSLKPTTVNRRINALRTFFGWLQTRKVRADNPAQELRFVRRATRNRPKGLNRTEALAMMRAAANSPHGMAERNCALLQLMMQTGLRVAEVVGLKQIDLTIKTRSGSVHVREGKGLKDREVPLNSTARQSLGRYLQSLESRSPTQFVFMSKRKTPLSVRAIQDLVGSIAERAEIKRIPVSAHTLRHTFAVNYLASNPGKLVELAALMGHDSLNTTAIYLRPSEEDLSKDLERSALNVLGD